MGYSHDKPQIKHIPNRPPAKRGITRPVRIKNGRRNWRGIWIEGK